jgi:hypothetical protein
MLKKIFKIKNVSLSIITGYFFLFTSQVAFAQTAVSNVGQMIQQLGTNISQPLAHLMVMLAYLFGMWMMWTGLTHIVNSSKDGGRSGYMNGVTRMMGGSLMVGLPSMLNIAMATIYGSSSTFSGINAASVGTPTQCISFGGSGSGSMSSSLTCVAQNLAVNVVPIFINVSFVFFFLIGTGIIFHSLYTLSTSYSRGQRDLPKGWVARMAIGSLTLSIPSLISLIAGSLGVTSGGVIGKSGFVGSSSTLLAYSTTTSGLAQYAQLIQYIFVIMVMFGLIAVWRGITILRKYADGGGQAPIGAGLTHILGGVMLVNSKWTVCIVLNSLIGAGGTLGFCS